MVKGGGIGQGRGRVSRIPGGPLRRHPGRGLSREPGSRAGPSALSRERSRIGLTAVRDDGLWRRGADGRDADPERIRRRSCLGIYSLTCHPSHDPLRGLLPVGKACPDRPAMRGGGGACGGDDRMSPPRDGRRGAGPRPAVLRDGPSVPVMRPPRTMTGSRRCRRGLGGRRGVSARLQRPAAKSSPEGFWLFGASASGDAVSSRSRPRGPRNRRAWSAGRPAT
jgi:hypothetical protein